MLPVSHVAGQAGSAQSPHQNAILFTKSRAQDSLEAIQALDHARVQRQSTSAGFMDRVANYSIRWIANGRSPNTTMTTQQNIQRTPNQNQMPIPTIPTHEDLYSSADLWAESIEIVAEIEANLPDMCRPLLSVEEHFGASSSSWDAQEQNYVQPSASVRNDADNYRSSEAYMETMQGSATSEPVFPAYVRQDAHTLEIVPLHSHYQRMTAVGSRRRRASSPPSLRSFSDDSQSDGSVGDDEDYDGPDEYDAGDEDSEDDDCEEENFEAIGTETNGSEEEVPEEEGNGAPLCDINAHYVIATSQYETNEGDDSEHEGLISMKDSLKKRRGTPYPAECLYLPSRGRQLQRPMLALEDLPSVFDDSEDEQLSNFPDRAVFLRATHSGRHLPHPHSAPIYLLATRQISYGTFPDSSHHRSAPANLATGMMQHYNDNGILFEAVDRTSSNRSSSTAYHTAQQICSSSDSSSSNSRGRGLEIDVSTPIPIPKASPRRSLASDW